MRSISFEKLRRLVGRKKDRNEPSFKRSESFKRISIRKSYLDRGKRRTKVQQQKINETGCNNNKTSVSPNNVSTTTVLVEEDKVKNEEKKKDNILYEIDDMKIGGEVKLKNSNSSLRTTIAYDDWLNDINDGRIKEIFYDDEKVPDELSNYDDISMSEKTEESLDLSEDFEALRLTSMSSYSRSTLSDVCSKSTLDDIESVALGENGPPSVSVSLGRVWLGAALMPFPSISSISSSSSLATAAAAAASTISVTTSSTTSTPSIASVTCVSNGNNNKSRHRSLDSAWKEHNKSRYETSSSSSLITVARTVSAPEKSQINTSYLSNSTSKIGDCSKLKKTRLSLFGKKKIGKSKGVTEIVFDNDSNLQLDPERFNFVLPEKRKLKKASHVWQEIRFCSIFEPSIDTVDTPNSINTKQKISTFLDNSNTTKNYKEFSNSCSNHDSQISDEEIFHYQTFKSSSTYSKSSIVSDVISPHGPKISDFNEDKILSEKLRGILAQRPVWQPNEKKLQKKIYEKKIYVIKVYCRWFSIQRT